jgi:hypothetical protein
MEPQYSICSRVLDYGAGEHLAPKVDAHPHNTHGRLCSAPLSAPGTSLHSRVTHQLRSHTRLHGFPAPLRIQANRPPQACRATRSQGSAMHPPCTPSRATWPGAMPTPRAPAPCQSGAVRAGSRLITAPARPALTWPAPPSLGRLDQRGWHLHLLHPPRRPQVQRLDNVLPHSHLAQRVDERLRRAQTRAYQKFP